MTTQAGATTISEILPGRLYQSGIVSAAEVAAGRFSAVVDLTPPGENPYPRPERDPSVLRHSRTARYIHVPLVDAPGELPDMVAVYDIVDQVVAMLADGERVLVHCVLGLNRSSLVNALVLCQLKGISGSAAIRRIRAARGAEALYNRAFSDYLERAHPGREHEPRAPGCTIWPAARLGPQVHAGMTPPTPAKFEPVRQWELGHPHRKNQNWGGFWTCSPTYTPQGLTSPFVEHGLNGVMSPAHWRDTRAWFVLPNPAARLLVVDGPASYQAVLAHYRCARHGDIDFEAAAAAGFAGVHVPAAGIARCPELGDNWGHTSTFWLRWVFGDAPREAPLVRSVRAALALPLLLPVYERMQAGDRFFSLLPPYSDQGLCYRTASLDRPRTDQASANQTVAAPLDMGTLPLVVQLHAAALLRAAAPRDPLGEAVRLHRLLLATGSDAAIILTGLRAVLDYLIIDHNFIDAAGRPLPVGPGLFAALVAHANAPGPLGLGTMAAFSGAICLCWSLAIETDRPAGW